MTTELNKNQPQTGADAPAQTQNQTTEIKPRNTKLVKIAIRKEVKQTKTLKVPKHIYNTIRSFVESSSRKEYVWNTGYDIGDRVVFEKPGKWLLIVKKEVEVREGETATVAVLKMNGKSLDVVAEYVIDFEHPFVGTVKINGETIDNFDQIVPEEEGVPFVRPVFGYEVKEMFEQFFRVDYYI